MKVSTISILLFIISNCPSVQAQTIDTLIDVGGYKLHFNIIKGKGIPILFDAGGGEDATTWKKIIQPIAERTATTLIQGRLRQKHVRHYQAWHPEWNDWPDRCYNNLLLR